MAGTGRRTGQVLVLALSCRTRQAWSGGLVSCPVFPGRGPVEQVYAYWRDFSHFPAFMPDVEEVTVIGPTTSHGRSPGPLGRSVEGDAEIVEDVPNQRIAWKSVGDADAVRFDDRGGRTNIEVSLECDPPCGKAGELVAELVKDPDKQVRRARGRIRLLLARALLGF